MTTHGQHGKWYWTARQHKHVLHNLRSACYTPESADVCAALAPADHCTNDQIHPPAFRRLSSCVAVESMKEAGAQVAALPFSIARGAQISIGMRVLADRQGIALIKTSVQSCKLLLFCAFAALHATSGRCGPVSNQSFPRIRTCVQPAVGAIDGHARQGALRLGRLLLLWNEVRRCAVQPRRPWGVRHFWARLVLRQLRHVATAALYSCARSLRSAICGAGTTERQFGPSCTLPRCSVHSSLGRGASCYTKSNVEIVVDERDTMLAKCS